MYIQMQGLGSDPSQFTSQEVALADSVNRAIDSIVVDVHNRNQALSVKLPTGQSAMDQAYRDIAGKQSPEYVEERRVESQILETLKAAQQKFPASGLLGAYTSQPLYELHQDISDILGLVASHKNLYAHIDNAIRSAVPSGLGAGTLRDLQEATYMLYLAKARTLGDDPKGYVGRAEKPVSSTNNAPTAGVKTPEGGPPYLLIGGIALFAAWFLWPRRRS